MFLFLFYNWKTFFFSSIVNSFFRKKFYLLAYFTYLLVKLDLMIFTKGQTIKTVFFQIDKKTAFTYLWNMGGASSSTLITITKKIWGILMSKGATFTVDYLQIALDQKAEWQSSYIQDSFEWKLLPQKKNYQIFRKRSQVLRQPKIDLSLVKSNSTLLLIETGPPKARDS